MILIYHRTINEAYDEHIAYSETIGETPIETTNGENLGECNKT